MARTAAWPATSCRVETDNQAGEPLIQPVMQGGRRLRRRRRSPTSARAPRAISSGCRSRCARSNQGRPIRSRSRTRWCGLPPKSTSGWRSRKGRPMG